MVQPSNFKEWVRLKPSRMLNFNTKNCVGPNSAVITYLKIHNLSPTMNLVYRIKTTAP